VSTTYEKEKKIAIKCRNGEDMDSKFRGPKIYPKFGGLVASHIPYML
jgi:hypothetical protein